MAPEDNLPAATPDFDDLADTNDPAVLEARAKLLREYHKAQRAQVPQPSFFDKVVIRAVIPIAIAVITPWAAWKFSASQHTNEKVTTEVTELKSLIKSQRERMEEQRERFQEIERQKAEELAAMSAMVIRLNETLKAALIQMAVAQALAEREGRVPLSKDEVVEQVQTQMALPNADPEEVKQLVGASYDRISKQAAGK